MTSPRIWLSFIAAALLTGCSEELGPERFETTRVTGKMTLAGKPITSGFVLFMPVDGTQGHLRTSYILPDGSYSVDRVAAGRNIVGIAGVFGPTIITQYGPMQFTDFHDYKSPIRKEIPPGSASQLDIDLLNEASVYLHDRQLPYPPMSPAP